MESEPLSSFMKVSGNYPYRRPDGSCLVVPYQNRVYYLELPPGDHGFLEADVQFEKQTKKLYDILEDKPEELVPMVFYGSGCCPYRIYYALETLNLSSAFPMFRGSSRNKDVVFSAYVPPAGSIPAQMVESPGTKPEAWVALLKKNQAMAMHKSENVIDGENGNYSVGPIEFIFDGGYVINGYGYYSMRKTFFDALKEMPVAFASASYGTKKVFSDFVPVEAEGRVFPERTQKEMMYIFNRALQGELYTNEWELTEWGKGNLDYVNKEIEETFGRDMQPDVERIKNPYEPGSLKTLGDCLRTGSSI